MTRTNESYNESYADAGRNADTQFVDDLVRDVVGDVGRYIRDIDQAPIELPGEGDEPPVPPVTDPAQVARLAGLRAALVMLRETIRAGPPARIVLDPATTGRAGGLKGGKAKTEAKRAASAENGRKGGRPRKQA